MKSKTRADVYRASRPLQARSSADARLQGNNGRSDKAPGLAALFAGVLALLKHPHTIALWCGLAFALVSIALQPGGIGLSHLFGIAGALFIIFAIAFRQKGEPLQPPSKARDLGEDKLNAQQLAALSDDLDHRLEQLQDSKWELSETTTRYRELLDAQNGLILRRNASGELTFVNTAFCKAFGGQKSELLGSRFQPTVVELDCDDGDEGNGDPGGPAKSQRVMTVDGPRWILWETHKHRLESGDVETQLIGHDITHQKVAAAQLRHARDEAEQGSRAKSRFLAAMSHEIRTPMNGILGMTSLLRETPQSPEQMSYCDAIKQSALALLGLIDEVLDFSKIEAGKLALSKQPFAVDKCIQSAVELLAPRAHEKGIQLAWRVDPACPAEISGDEARVHQILLNLLSNAIKFTDHGGVMLSATVNPFEAGSSSTPVEEHVFQIDVTDTGIGMSVDEREALFHEFEQANTAIARRGGGTGLGLAISKRLATAMGGDVTVTSAPGEGSTFSFFVPIAVSCLSPPRGEEPGTYRGNRVLMVGSLDLERGVMARIARDHHVETVESTPGNAIGEIEKAQRRDAPFDRVVVFGHCDHALARQIIERAQAACPGASGLVAVDAIERRLLAKFNAAGFKTYLIRPVRPGVLLREIAAPQGAGGRRSVANRDGETPLIDGKACATVKKASGSRLILLAEDNAVNELLATRIIEKAGHRSISVRTGTEAVDYMRASLNGETATADLVLMDILMPELDGVKATQQIKALYMRRFQSTRRCPPIIALTANAFDDDRKRYLDNGLDDYLSKPFEASQLVQLIDRWCGFSRSAGSDPKPALDAHHTA